MENLQLNDWLIIVASVVGVLTFLVVIVFCSSILKNINVVFNEVKNLDERVNNLVTASRRMEQMTDAINQRTRAAAAKTKAKETSKSKSEKDSGSKNAKTSKKTRRGSGSSRSNSNSNS